jgi:hypothetical protein
VINTYGFKDDATGFLNRIAKEQFILVRVEKKLELECINEIQALITGEVNNESTIDSSRNFTQSSQRDRDREGDR